MMQRILEITTRIGCSNICEYCPQAKLIKNYTPKDLINKQIAAVVNFKPKQIGNLMSEVLVLGLPDENNQPVLVRPLKKILNGKRLY